MKKLGAKFGALFLALTLVLTGCGGGSSSKSGGTLTVGFSSTNDGMFSPVFYKSSYDAWVVDAIFEPLVSFDSENQFTPVLAEEMPEVSEDGLTYTFKIRDSKFSDGNEVTADDVIFTYTVIADAKYTGRFGSYANDFVGYEEYRDGAEDGVESISGIEKVDDKTVSFTFKEAARGNMERFTRGIMEKAYYAPDYKNGDAAVIESKMQEPMGSGPYVLQLPFDPTAGVVLTKNPNYVGDGYAVETVIIKPLTQQTDIQALENGEIDLLPGMIEPQKIKTAEDSEILDLRNYDRSGYGYITFNTEATATKDKSVRQALAYGFDVQGFVDSYFANANEGGEPLAIKPKTIYNPISWIYGEDGNALDGKMTEYTFDLEKAAQILDDAGWKVGASGYREKDGEVLELKVLSMPDHDILDTLVPMWKSDWGDNLKMKITVNTVDFNVLSNMITEDSEINNWSMFFLAVSFTDSDPGHVKTSYHSDYAGNGLDNYARLRNPELDKMMDDAELILDEKDAIDAYVEIGKVLQDEVPTVPVYANVYHDLFNKKVKNLNTNSLYNWVRALKDVTIEE